MTSADFDSPFERLAFLYFPPQFRGQFFNVSSGEILARLEGFWQEASFGLVIAAVAIVSLFIPRRDPPARWCAALLLILAFVTFLAFAVTYNVYDFHVYYIPAILILSILVGLGVDAVVDLFAWIPKLPRFVPVCLGAAFLVLGFYSSLGAAGSHWRERIPPLLDDWDAYFYENPAERRLEAEDVLNGIEDNAIVFTDWDYAYDYYYVAHILQGRTEMDFHETYPQEGVSQLADSAIEYIEANIDARPIYFSERPSLLAGKYKITRAASGLFQLERK
jgi:hypothetical protein